MSPAKAASFKVGLLQMRSGLDPAANLNAALDLVNQAKTADADYVQTPEMTNILALKREQLFATIVAEEQDPTLARLREAARKLSTYIHIGSLAIKASPEKAVNRSFLIDRKGEVAARYDKIQMSILPMARATGSPTLIVPVSLPSSPICHGAGSGLRCVTICAFRRFIVLWPRPAHHSWRSHPRSPAKPAKHIGTYCNARVPLKTDVLCSPLRRAASMKMAARLSVIRWWSTRGDASWPKAAPSRDS